MQIRPDSVFIDTSLLFEYDINMIPVSIKKRLALTSALLLLVLSLTGGNSGMVLCVQPGGHIEFENEMEGCCDDAEVSDAGGSSRCSSSVLTELNDCGSCVDIPLSGIDHCIRAGHGAGLSKSMPADKLAFGALPVRLTLEAFTPGPHHYNTRQLASVRPVTLRI